MTFKIKKGLHWESINNSLAFAILTENFGFVSPSILAMFQGDIIVTKDGLMRYE